MIVVGEIAPSEDREPSSESSHVAACLNLSHELRTPTNAILGHVELLLSGSAGPLTFDMRASLGEIQEAALALHRQLGMVIRLAEDLPVPMVDQAIDKPTVKE